MSRPHTASPRLGAQETPSHRLELVYKGVVVVLPHATQSHRKPPSSTLRPLSPSTRAAPTFPRTPCSSPFHLLPRPSCRLAGVTPPAAPAAGLRRARPPALVPPQVSTQIEPLQHLDPSPTFSRPSPVDVKSAPHAKHTASRISWLNTRGPGVRIRKRASQFSLKLTRMKTVR
jgi:hypothetical protein